MSSAVATLVVKIVTEAKAAQKGLDDTATTADKMKAGIGKAAKVSAVVLGGLAAAAIGAAKAAAEDASGQAQLANAMVKTTGASKGQIAANEAWIASLSRATGVADDDLRPAMGTLLRATGDVATSQQALKTAMDVSAATGKPLGAVSAALAKGYGGNAKALGKLVPGMDKAVLASGDMNKVMAELARTTGGSAAKAAATAGGQMAIATNNMNEAKEAIGAGLLPVMGQFASILAVVGVWAQNNAKTIQILAVAIALIAGAVLVVNAALKVYQATLIVIQVVQAATWLSNPIFLVIAAVILLVSGIILLWKKSETFRNIVLGVWAAIRTAASATVGWIVNVFTALWSGISGGARAVAGTVKAIFTAIGAAGAAVGRALSGAWRAVWSALSAGARAVVGAFKSAWSVLEAVLLAPFRALDAAIRKILDLIGSIASKVRSIKLPHIPGLSALTSAAAPAPAVAGLGASRRGVGAAVPAVAGGGTTINVYGILDGVQGARVLRQVLRDDDRRRRGVRVMARSVSA